MSAQLDWDPSKPLIYLDHSTWCDALFSFPILSTSARRKTTSAAYRPVFEWITNISTKTNLCLSSSHLTELGRWGDDHAVEAMVEWWEHLPIAWVRAPHIVEQMEVDYVMKLAAGVQPKERPTIIAPRVVSAFDSVLIEHTPGLLSARRPIREYVFAARRVPREREDRTMPSWAHIIRADRKQVDVEGWSTAEKDQRLADNRREGLRRHALESDRRMTMRADPEYLAKSCSSEEAQDRFVEWCERDPASLPSLSTLERFHAGFIEEVTARLGGKKEQKDYRGTLHDGFHAVVGAAHAEVFTCDVRVDEWLGNLRTSRGMRKQLSAGGHPAGIEGFVTDLVASVA